MAKKEKGIFGILTESIGLYFSNFDKFFKYMSFPVLGQIAGLVLIFLTTYFYSVNMPKLIDKYPDLNNLGTLVGISVVIALPGLAIFCKAFWDFLVAYGAINSMLENMLKSGRVYDFAAHNELIKRRTIPFIGLWLLYSIFFALAACPLLWVPAGIFVVYFVLVFQVFTFEPELSPVGCAKKSLALVKGHFRDTFILLFLIGVLTYSIIPHIVTAACNGIGITTGLSNAIMPFVNLLPELHLEQFGFKILHSDMASVTVNVVIAQIFIQYTLPLRSILWSMWYKELNGSIPQPEYNTKITKKKRTSKRPSEKLMEESRKKFSKEKLDDNIIRRAMEKDDEE